MKTIPAGLLAVYASGGATICACLVVERRDGVFERFTSSDRNVVIATAGAPYDGTYLAATGLDVSNLVVQASLAVDNMELTVLPDETSYPQVDILAGLWDGAKFRLFECSYADTTLGVNLLKRGTTGEADVLRSTRKFEFRGLKQPLQQQLVPVMQKTCRYRLGSTAMPAGLCFIDLGSLYASWTNTYTITAVASRHEFTCWAATEDDDFYGEGIVQFVDGVNTGQNPQKIKSFAAGVFTLSLPTTFLLEVGDNVTVQAGCRKRLDEDCKTKFDNVLNFGGEPHVVGADLLTADPTVSV